MFCPKCGTQVPEGAQACPSCGHEFAQKKEIQPAQATAPQQTLTTPAPSTAPAPAVQAAQTVQPATTAAPGGALRIAGLVLGIVGVLIDFLPGISAFGCIAGIVGIVISAMALSKNKTGEGNGLAVAGLVCSIIAVVFGLGSLLCWGGCLGCAGATDMALRSVYS